MIKKFFPLRVSARMFFLVLGLLLCGMSVFGWVLASAMGGSQRAGWVGRAAIQLAVLPNDVRTILNGRHFGEVSGGLATDKAGFERLLPNSPSEGEAGLLIPRYSSEAGHFVVDLVSEESGEIWRRYDPKLPAMGFALPAFGFEGGIEGARARFIPTHPMLTEDGGLVFAGSSPLIRVDACSKPVWTIAGGFHHSIENDSDGNYWVPRRLSSPTRKAEALNMAESELVKIHPDGKILVRIPMYKIFADNGMQAHIDGQPTSVDPYHINDIQPVMKSGPYWQKDDLFLSLRNLSMVLLYRPSTGKVIWHQKGPWLAQHDVNILDDYRISIFDNHVSMGFAPGRVDGTNRLAIVDFRNGAVSFDYDTAFKNQAIKTVSQGRGIILPGGDMLVEETNYGRLLRVAPNGAIRWRFIHKKPNGPRMTLAWSRYLDPTVFAGAIKNAKAAKCQSAN